MIYDEPEGLNFYVNFGAIAETFGDPERATNRQPRPAVLGYLEEPLLHVCRRPDTDAGADFGRGADLMARPPNDEEREQRIAMKIVVDAYGPEEQAMGWYYYLEDKLGFPFQARCVAQRAISPLRIDDEVEITGMAPEDECEHEMFVVTRWERGSLAVPLSQLEGMAVDDETRQAIEDWHYWVARGYEW